MKLYNQFRQSTTKLQREKMCFLHVKNKTKTTAVCTRKKCVNTVLLHCTKHVYTSY